MPVKVVPDSEYQECDGVTAFVAYGPDGMEGVQLFRKTEYGTERLFIPWFAWAELGWDNPAIDELRKRCR